MTFNKRSGLIMVSMERGLASFRKNGGPAVVWLLQRESVKKSPFSPLQHRSRGYVLALHNCASGNSFELALTLHGRLS